MTKMRRCCCAFVLSGLSLISAQVASAQDVAPLQSINSKIAAIVDAGASPGEVQVATLPATVSWDDDGGRYAFYQLCDTLAGWGATIKPNAITISDRYQQYLLGLEAVQGDPLANDAQLKAAQKTAKFQKDYATEQQRLRTLWNKTVESERNIPEPNKTSYSQFMRDNSAQLAALEVAITSSYSSWLPAAQAAAPSTAGRVLGDLLGPAYRVKVKTYSGAELSVLECSPSINLKKALEDAKIAAESDGIPDVTLAFGHQTGQVDSSWSKWSGSAGWGPFSVSASQTRSNYSINTNDFRLRLELPVILRFTLVRPWLNMAVIDTYKDTAIRPGSELEKLKPLFGEKGSFALVSQEFVVAYQPRVTVKMASNDYSSAKTSYSGGGSFGIGPFSIGGGASGGSSSVKWDDTNSEVTIGTSSTSFVLLGVRNKVLP